MCQWLRNHFLDNKSSGISTELQGNTKLSLTELSLCQARGNLIDEAVHNLNCTKCQTKKSLP